MTSSSSSVSHGSVQLTDSLYTQCQKQYQQLTRSIETLKLQSKESRSSDIFHKSLADYMMQLGSLKTLVKTYHQLLILNGSSTETSEKMKAAYRKVDSAVRQYTSLEKPHKARPESADIQALRQHNASLVAQQAALQAQIASLTQEIQRLNSLQQPAEMSLNTQLTHLMGGLDTTAEMLELKEQLKAVNAEKTALEAQLQTVSAQKAQIEERCNAIQARLNTQDSQIQTYQGKIQELESTIAAQNARHANQVAFLQHCEHLTGSIVLANQSIHQLHTALETAQIPLPPPPPPAVVTSTSSSDTQPTSMKDALAVAARKRLANRELATQPGSSSSASIESPWERPYFWKELPQEVQKWIDKPNDKDLEHACQVIAWLDTTLETMTTWMQSAQAFCQRIPTLPASVHSAVAAAEFDAIFKNFDSSDWGIDASQSIFVVPAENKEISNEELKTRFERRTQQLDHSMTFASDLLSTLSHLKKFAALRNMHN